MSPNALRGLAPSYSDDIYSFAITMWQLESRQHPYHNYRCNDSVAYNVVKTNLRPDQDELIVGSHIKLATVTPSKIRSTILPTHRMSSPSSFVLRANSISPSFQSKSINSRSFIPVDQRINNAIHTVENFNQISKKIDFTRLKPVGSKFDSYDKNDLLLAFQDVFAVMDLRFEYKKMYVKCWHSDANVRPIATNLAMEFKRFLGFFKQSNGC